VANADELAARLRTAYAKGAVAPLRDGLDGIDGDTAYRIQQINTEYWQGQGRRIVGRKIGLTAPAVQAQLGVSQPDHGVLFDDMLIPDGGTLAPEKTLQPKAEAEVALMLERDLAGAGCTVEDVMAACAYASTAIEIVDSRIADWKITFADTVADNGSSGFFVLGRERKPVAGLDLWSCGMVLEVNGKVASLGAGAACLGHPLAAAAWLVRTLTVVGQTLRAGDIIMTGALGPMVALRPSDKIQATIGGLGRCSFEFGAGK
jgi:2-keto-4-pentenoate hydratase